MFTYVYVCVFNILAERLKKEESAEESACLLVENSWRLAGSLKQVSVPTWWLLTCLKTVGGWFLETSFSSFLLGGCLLVGVLLEAGSLKQVSASFSSFPTWAAYCLES